MQCWCSHKHVVCVASHDRHQREDSNKDAACHPKHTCHLHTKWGRWQSLQQHAKLAFITDVSHPINPGGDLGGGQTLDPQVKGLTKNVTSNFPERNPTLPPHHPLGDGEVTNHSYVHTWYNVLSFYVHAEHCSSAISFTLLALILYINKLL